MHYMPRKYIIFVFAYEGPRARVCVSNETPMFVIANTLKWTNESGGDRDVITPTNDLI